MPQGKSKKPEYVKIILGELYFHGKYSNSTWLFSLVWTNLNNYDTLVLGSHSMVGHLLLAKAGNISHDLD